MPPSDVRSCTDEQPAAAKLYLLHLRFLACPGGLTQKRLVGSVSEEVKRDALLTPSVLIASPMHFPSRPIRLLLSFSFCMVCTNSFAEPYTPAVGSPERVAIANGVRASVAQLGGQFEEDARRGAKFVIAVLKIEGRYAFFEGGGQEVNGEMTYGPVDIVAFLAKGNIGWKVLNLQARGDVPDDAEVAQLRASLPPDFPLNIVNKFWRDLLLGARRAN